MSAANFISWNSTRIPSPAAIRRASSGSIPVIVPSPATNSMGTRFAATPTFNVGPDGGI